MKFLSVEMLKNGDKVWEMMRIDMEIVSCTGLQQQGLHATDAADYAKGRIVLLNNRDAGLLRSSVGI
jgi:hypothetical protein